MGACTFMAIGRGDNAANAFDSAQMDALKTFGYTDGYSGTIASKKTFVRISLPDDKEPQEFALDLIDREDPRIDDKYGPAGCIQIDTNRYLFFGWAPE